MVGYVGDVRTYLRKTYFNNYYMTFGMTDGVYQLSIEGTVYSIPVVPYNQYQELQDYVENSYKDRYPELFL